MIVGNGADLLQSGRGPISFPWGVSPGFNPNHPAMRGVTGVFSAVCTANGWRDLRTGKKGIYGTPAGHKTVFRSDIGPAGFSTGTAPFGGVTFPNQYVFPASSKLTCAAVFFCPAGTGGNLIATDSTASGFNMGQVYFVNSISVSGSGGNDSLSYYSFTTNDTPYFIIFSSLTGSGPDDYWVLTNLKTGCIYFVQGGAWGGNGNVSDGTFGVQFNDDGWQSAAMFTNNYMRPDTALAWAADPWSFWYPRIKTPWARSPLVFHQRPDADVSIGNWSVGA